MTVLTTEILKCLVHEGRENTFESIDGIWLLVGYLDTYNSAFEVPDKDNHLEEKNLR